MTTARRLHYSYEDYRRALKDSRLKLEFSDGVIYAMAGGTPQHAELAASVTALLRQALMSRCRVYSSDLNIHVEATGLSTFPDGSVVCGPLATLAIDPNAVVNPTLLVEVTSNSTEDYDRGDKLSNYKQIPSLRAVLIVSHRAQRVTLVQRAGDGGWDERDVRSGETVELNEPALRLPIDDLYAGIELELPGSS
jgi:Uma2 family endonuclease